jgi:tetratricopeptide (TPR) repeat protein
MHAGCWLRWRAVEDQNTLLNLHDHLVNQRSRVSLSLLFALLLFSHPTPLLAQNTASIPSNIVHGTAVTSHGYPLAGATIEIRDLHGVKIRQSVTDAAGAFETRTDTAPGEYVVIVAKGTLIGSEQISLPQSNGLQIRIESSTANGTASPRPSRYTVSANTLALPAKARAHMEAAHKRFIEMNLRGAMSEANRALLIVPNCPQALSLRAFIKLAMRDVDGAIEDAARAVSVDPGDVEPYVALGMAYNTAKDFSNAAAYLEKALSIRPDDWQGRLEMAKSLYGQCKFVLALYEIGQVRQDFPDVHLLRANVLMRLERRHEAAEEFNAFLKQAPNDERGDKVRQIVSEVQQTAMNAAPPQR